ncbi:MAG: hypothetical protein AABO58_15500 [Acidobacteriota bacterium]
MTSDAVSSIAYDSPKPKEIVDEDKLIGVYKLNIKPENVRIVPVDEVFSK